MRKVKFYLGTGFTEAIHEEIMEYEDDVTNDEISEDFEDWKNDKLDASWWDLEEE